jgi:hypothetical protein
VPAEECYLCGLTDRDVVLTWARFKEPVDGEHYASIYRCKDRARCRERVETAGKPWPLVGGGDS